MIKKIAVSLTLSSMLLMGASPLIVSDPKNTASNAIMIEHFIDSIVKYEDMMGKAKEQVKTNYPVYDATANANTIIMIENIVQSIERYEKMLSQTKGEKND